MKAGRVGEFLSLRSNEVELTEQLPAGLAKAIETNLGSDYHLDSLAVVYDEIGVHLEVQIVGQTPASGELASQIRSTASDLYDQPVRVGLSTKIEIHSDNPE